MDDHQDWQDGYRAAVRRQWTERALIAGLCLAVAAAGWLVWRNWTTRFETVFHPIPGLSYDAPLTSGGVPVTTIADPLSYQRLSTQDAYAFNASVPVSTEMQVPSAAFVISTAAGSDGARALDCLTAAVYYEAATESLDGQRAVAQVVLNRVRHSAFPQSVCGVVFSGSTRRTGCQFTFTCDGALYRRPSAGGWARARIIAQAALSGQVYAPVGQATHYHTLWVAPYWSPSLVKVANIGAHTFYRWKGFTGAPGAFNRPYSGVEPLVDLTPDREDSPAMDPSLEVLPEGIEPAAAPEPAILFEPAAPPPSVPDSASEPAAAIPPPAAVAAPPPPPPTASTAPPIRRRSRVATPD